MRLTLIPFHIRFPIFWLTLFCLISGGLFFPAQANAINEIGRAIFTLREDNAKLHERLQIIQSGENRINSNLDDLQNEQKNLRSKIEEVQNRLLHLETKLSERIASIDQRLQKLEPQLQTLDGVQGIVSPNEKTSFASALELYKSDNFNAAQIAFIEFLKQYPASLFASEAKFWLANAFYGQKKYTDSLREFNALMNQYPHSQYAIDSLSTIADIYAEKKEKQNERKVLQRILKTYPNAENIDMFKSRLEKLS